jgi:hypothetical protein
MKQRQSSAFAFPDFSEDERLRQAGRIPQGKVHGAGRLAALRAAKDE